MSLTKRFQERRRDLLRGAFALAIAVVSTVTPAEGTPIYLVSVTGGQAKSGSTTLFTSGTVDGGTGAARSGPGGLGAFASALSGGLVEGARARASVTLDDLVFSGPPGMGVVDTSFNLHLSGTLNLTPPVLPLIPGATHATAGAYVLTEGDVGGIIGLSGLINPCKALPTQFDGCAGFPSYYTSGLFASAFGFAFDQVFTTTLGTLPLNVPLRLFLAFEAGAGALGPGVSGTADFLSTLWFPTVGPVFNLPDGYTVNSLSAGIVNNRFGAQPAAAVPEPATIVLVGAGLLGKAAAAVRRRRHGRRSQADCK